jgi:Tfp pilus assembly protein PilF
MSESVRNDRIKLLKGFLEQDPNDSFSRYALALEYANTGLTDDAIKEFEAVIEKDPNYTATYYHLGKAYVKNGDVGKAKATYRKGVELTAQTGEKRANQELREALLMLVGGE